MVNINLIDENIVPVTTSAIQVELYNNMGSKQKSLKLNNNKGTMSVSGLLQGIYTLKIIYDNKVESHQVIVK